MYAEVPLREAQPVEPFSYEHVWTMREDDYLRMNSLTRPSLRSNLKFAGLTLIGGLLMIWPLSAGIGLVILGFAGLLWSLPHIYRSGLRQRFGETRYLRGPIAYGVSGRGFWATGQDLSAESSWAGLGVWRQKEGWLILSGSGMPPVYLPVDGLRDGGVYDRVIALARRHGKPFEDARASGDRGAVSPFQS